MTETTRSYGGKTGDERRSERRGQLIAAGRALLSTEGWSRTSVRAVCARAGLADRYFYESFEDRDAMLAAVFDNVAAEAMVGIGAALVKVPQEPRARARAAVGALVDLIDADPGTARVALFDTPDSAVVLAHRRQALRGFVTLIAGQAQAIYGDAAPDPSDRELTAHALIGAMQELLLARDQGEIKISRERLIEHAAALAEAAALVTSA